MPQDNGRTNILVLGSGDPGHAGENLTDTMIMLSTSRRKQHNGMVSLPGICECQFRVMAVRSTQPMH